MENSPENSDNSPEKSEEIPKRGRGRPKGSKDTAPRRTRIREVSPEPAKEAAAPKEAKPREPKAQPQAEAAPPSPRTVFRQASDSLAALQGQREAARRAYWQDAIARSLR
jgi:hypothetical protein